MFHIHQGLDNNPGTNSELVVAINAILTSERTKDIVSQFGIKPGGIIHMHFSLDDLQIDENIPYIPSIANDLEEYYKAGTHTLENMNVFGNVLKE